MCDADLTDAEMEQMLDQCKDDKELRECWQRYHLIGEVIRNNLPPTLNFDISSRVSEALAKEPTVLAPQRRSSTNRNKFFKNAAGFAIAASVATIAVFAVNVERSAMMAQGQHSGTVQVVAQTSTQPVKVTSKQTDEKVASKINNFVVNHSANTLNASMPGVLPYARIVGSNAGQTPAQGR